jgi:hypothetical protein
VLTRLWRRPPSPSTPVEVEQAPAPPPGDLPCSERSCAAQTGTACVYQDRRGRRCPTAWCPEHRVVVDGDVYCRRHAGVVQAVAGAVAQPPDVENRAASLARWVGSDLDPLLRALLEKRPAAIGLTVSSVHPVHIGFNRVRAWEWSWKLLGDEGIAATVSIHVEERQDDQVVVCVGAGVVVARLTPPWIERRHQGLAADPALDAAARTEFYRTIVDRVMQCLDDADRLDAVVASQGRHLGL